MKKSLLALALLGAVAFSAQAGQVTLYGTVDGGFQYTNAKTKFLGSEKLVETKTNTFQLADGLGDDNKFGLMGSEDLGNGLEVGFQLESGFHIANGAMTGAPEEPGAKTILFDREARVYVKGPFGELAAGRIGSLGSASGSYDMFFANGDAFDGGDKIGSGFAGTDKLNNSLTYVTPDFGGFQAYAQYSFSKVDDQKDKFNKNDRQWGLGATFSMDNFAVAALVEQGIPATKNADGTAVDPKEKKPISFGLGANVKFDNVTVYAAGQYAKHPEGLAYGPDEIASHFSNGIKNNIAFTLGTQIEVGQGNFTVAGYLAQAKLEANNKKLQYMSLNGRYTYNLSDRTSVYVGADAGRAKNKATNEKATMFTAYTGLTHNF